MKKFLLILLAGFTSMAVVAQDQQKIENLVTFAKLYGYVKYFHPSDEAASIDWERFAIYGAQRVENARDSRELRRRLEGLFLPIAPSIKLYGQTDARTIIHATCARRRIYQ